MSDSADMITGRLSVPSNTASSSFRTQPATQTTPPLEQAPIPSNFLFCRASADASSKTETALVGLGTVPGSVVRSRTVPTLHSASGMEAVARSSSLVIGQRCFGWHRKAGPFCQTDPGPRSLRETRQ